MILDLISLFDFTNKGYLSHAELAFCLCTISSVVQKTIEVEDQNAWSKAAIFALVKSVLIPFHDTEAREVDPRGAWHLKLLTTAWEDVPALSAFRDLVTDNVLDATTVDYPENVRSLRSEVRSLSYSLLDVENAVADCARMIAQVGAEPVETSVKELVERFPRMQVNLDRCLTAARAELHKATEVLQRNSIVMLAHHKTLALQCGHSVRTASSLLRTLSDTVESMRPVLLAAAGQTFSASPDSPGLHMPPPADPVALGTPLAPRQPSTLQALRRARLSALKESGGVVRTASERALAQKRSPEETSTTRDPYPVAGQAAPRGYMEETHSGGGGASLFADLRAARQLCSPTLRTVSAPDCEEEEC